MAPWTVHRVTAPTTPDDAATWAVTGACRAHAATHRELFGHADAAWQVGEVASLLRDRPYERSTLLVVREGGTDGTDGADPMDPTDPADAVIGGDAAADAVVGAALVDVPTQDNPHLAVAETWVRPDARGRGVGQVLLDAVESAARAEDRRTLIVMSTHRAPADGEPTRGARSGTGAVPAGDRATRLADARGYGLEQVERFSTFTFPLDGERGAAVRRAHDDAARAAGDAYRLVAWTGPTPPEHLDGMAVLRTRMSTDVPTADLQLDEEPWDAERVRAHDREVVEQGRVAAVVAAQHVPTGELVAFTVVEWPPTLPEAAYQQDTLVVAAHRGHRLGMLVKTAQLLRLEDLWPGLRRLHTWNAQENDHMLAINVALGFAPTGVLGMWQRDLDGAEQARPAR